MKKRIEKEMLPQSICLLQPTRPIFCTTKNEDGSDHAAPFSWITAISFKPPRVGFALQNERGQKLSHSLVNILREREFVVNMPQMGQEYALVQASYGLVNHSCKFDRTGSAREDSEFIKPKMMADCVASIECKVFATLDTGGDHTLILADIVSAYYEEEYYNEMLWPDSSKYKPLINLREYRFDDRQEHIFIDSSNEYRVVIPYEKKE